MNFNVMFKESHIVRKIAKVFLYLFCLSLFLEGTSRILISIDPIFRKIKCRNDNYHRINWVKQHNDKKEFVYKFDVYHPTRGWALKPNIRDMTVFNGKFLNSNSKGIRGKIEYKYNKHSEKQRIMIIGDSYTFGDEVSDNETYSHFLGRLLPDYEVLNLGIHGYGHDQMLVYLKEEGVRYNPDIVILGYVWFDIFRNLRKFNSYSKPKFVLQNGKLQLTNVPVPTPISFLNNEIYRSKSFDVGSILFDKICWTFGINHKKAEELTKAILDEMVVTVRKSGAIPVFVYLPVLGEILNRDERMTSNEQFLLSYCEEQNINCLFLRKHFLKAEKEGIEFNTNSHWFANGNMVAAQGIKEYMVNEGLIQQK